MKYLWLLFLLTLLPMNAQTNDTLKPLVHVSGEGEVTAIPDGVDIRVRVENEGKDAREVKMQNDQTVSEVIAFLKKEGVDAKHVQTAYVNLNKNYNYNTKEYSYTANQTLKIQLKDLARYDAIMSGLLQSGINRIEGIYFTASKMESLKQEARLAAIKNAQTKASAYAQALGQSIGKAYQISEQGSYSPQPPVYATRMMAMDSESAGGPTIAPGELTIKVNINVSFVLY